MKYIPAILLCILVLTSCSQKPITQEKEKETTETKEKGDVSYFKPGKDDGSQSADGQQDVKKDVLLKPVKIQAGGLKVGAERLEHYLPELKGKKVAMVVNQTSVVDGEHLVDLLISRGVDVVTIFAPEHGFRGQADAGETVKNSKDIRTGLPIVSLYGSNKKPTAAQLAGIDIVVFDIQDVGARFYTYISTMHYVMEAGAENGVKVMVLDRPNPNGHYVDGPVLHPAFQSFVGMHPIPVVHGMTVAELAYMINEEGWLKGNKKCDLTLVSCIGYDHTTPYELAVKPSPNLPNPRSIYLYPSLCFFEGTTVSVGRGTNKQFQVIGSPDYNNYPFSFTPVPMPGAKYPKHENKKCKGLDLTTFSPSEIRQKARLDLSWLLQFYQLNTNKPAFFNANNFFDKLAGTDMLRKQIIAGATETAIRDSWQDELKAFKANRKKYLLYPDFE